MSTLLSMRTTIRQRLDMILDQHISDAEFNGYIQASAYELYDILVTAYGDEYYEKDTPYQFTADGINTRFALPDDFYKLLGVDLAITSTNPDGWITLSPFNNSDRNRWSLPQFRGAYGTLTPRYRLRANKLDLQPLPQSGQKFRLHYVPRMTDITSDSDSFDGISGWDEYIVADVMIKARLKREEDPSGELALKQALAHRIETVSKNRDEGRAATVSEVRRSNYDGWNWPEGL